MSDPSAMDYEDIMTGLSILLRDGWELEAYYDGLNYHAKLADYADPQRRSVEGFEADMGDALAAAVCGAQAMRGAQ
jgi:hypothetical protein